MTVTPKYHFCQRREQLSPCGTARCDIRRAGVSALALATALGELAPCRGFWLEGSSTCAAPASPTWGWWPSRRPLQRLSARAGAAQSQQQPARRRGPCRPRGTAAEGRYAAAAAGVLAELSTLELCHTQITDPGCYALAAAFKNGALPALDTMGLEGIPAQRRGAGRPVCGSPAILVRSLNSRLASF